MSSEDDVELKDLVTQALESNGVLSKIRAELRARVFLALEEHDFLQTEDAFTNPAFKSFVRTSEGALLTGLVREFLEFFGLNFTLSVYDPETGSGRDYKYDERSLLIKNLQLKLNGSQEPLLAHILRQASQPQPAPCPPQSTTEKSVGDSSAPPVERKTLPQPQPQPLPQPLSQPLSQPLPQPLPQSLSLPQPLLQHQPDAEPEAEPVEVPAEEPVATPRSISAPLQGVQESSVADSAISQPEASSSPPTSKKGMNLTKAASDHPDPSYDEDFQSSGSGSAREIDEDLGSGIDDLLSNASGMEDLTADATVSRASGAGDYLESL